MRSLRITQALHQTASMTNASGESTYFPLRLDEEGTSAASGP